jgi:hypothetical protein
MTFPTPSANEPDAWRYVEVVDKDGNPPAHPNQRFYDRKTGRVVQKTLEHIAVTWPTPLDIPERARGREPKPSGSERGRAAQRAGREERIPTPTHADSRASRNSTARRRPGARKPHAGDTLTDYVTLFPTPTASDARKGYRHAKSRRGGETLSGAVSALTEDGEGRTPGQLNPMWVEWLMGFPTGWTALPPSATPSSRRSRSG